MQAHFSWLIILGLCLSGCSSAPIVVEKPLDPTAGNLLRIGAAYMQFCAQNNRPPSGVKDIQPALTKAGGSDQTLQSTHDGQPLVICWGVDVIKGAPWAKSTPVLAYEKQGADGIRNVLTTMGNVQAMSEQEFREASFPPGHTPGS